MKDKIVYLFLAYCFWTALETNFYYVPFVLIMLYYISRKGSRFLCLRATPEDKIMHSFLFVWLYGFLLGFIMGNHIPYIIANFAGMVCYSIYFLFVKINLDVEKVIKMLMYAGYIVSFYSIINLYAFFNGINLFFLTAEIDYASSGQFRVYLVQLSFVYILYGYTMFYVLSKKKFYPYIKHPLLSLIICCISLFFVSASKGFTLGALFVFASVPGFYLFLQFFRGQMGGKTLLFIGLIPIMIFFLDYFGYTEVTSKMFDEEDVSNIERYDQMTFMINNLDIIGHGLGSLVPGSTRSIKAPYGYELTYINLIHKFGFMSIFLFWGWAHLFFKTLHYYRKGRCEKYCIVILASMGYMLPSVGNPLLMGPCMVILNSFAFYLLRCIRLNKVL